MKEPRLLQHVLADEIARLRAELAAATQWRNAINDALTSWHNPIDEEETPKEAIDRLIGYETANERLNALDPSLSQYAADLVATARREGMEEAERIAENEPEPEGEPPPELHGRSVKNIAIASVRATKRSIAAAIRAAAKEGK